VKGPRLRLQAKSVTRTLWLLGVAGLLAASNGPARAADPRIGWRLDAGASDPCKRPRAELRAENTSCFRLPLPASVSFQIRLAPPILGEVTTDSSGRLLVAHGTDRLTAVDASGKSLWSVRLGSELASGPIPVLGAALVVARDGRLFEVSASGLASERETLPWSDIEGTVISAPTSDGGVILATGARLLRVGPRGTRGFQTKVASAIRSVFGWRGATLFTWWIKISTT